MNRTTAAVIITLLITNLVPVLAETVTDLSPAHLKLKLEWLEGFSSRAEDIDSNFSGRMPEHIEEISRVYSSAIANAKTQSEWGAVAVQTNRAKAVFRKVAKLPVTKWVEASEADRAGNREQAAGVVTAGAAIGSPALILAGIAGHILAGPVNVKVEDPVQGVLIEKAANQAIQDLNQSLSTSAQKLNMGPVGRTMAKMIARCQQILVR